MRRRGHRLFLKGKSARARRRLLLVFALVFAPAAAERAHAGCVEFASPPEITTGADGARDVTAADLDGDGDLDALAASYTDGEIAWFANDGTGGGWTKTTISTGASFGYAAAAGDLDGDGDLDVVSAAKGGNLLTWYENDGTGTSWTTHQLFTTGSFSAVAVADVDRDGDQDLFTGQIGGALHWVDNEAGDFSVFSLHAIRTGAGAFREIFAADVDRDGDADLLSAADTTNELAWHANDGDGGGWTVVTISSAAGSIRGVAAADVDGDGDLDALSAELSPGALAWHENNDSTGDGSTWTTHSISTSTSGLFSVYPADLDGDGDADALSASSTSRVAWHENLGAGAAWSLHTISTSAANTNEVFAADLDADGDLDAMSASTSDDTIAWYRNERLHDERLFGAAATLSTGYSNPLSIGGADLDHDGDQDVLATAFTGDAILWLENLAGDAASWTVHEVSTAANNPDSIAGADIDGDGDLDLVVSHYFEGTFWYENTAGDASVFSLITIHATGSGAATSIPADVDRDGDFDVVAVYPALDGLLAWHENTDADGDGSTWTIHEVSTAVPYAFFAAVADLDGDGWLDLAASEFADDAITWYENDGSPASGAWTVLTIASTLLGPRGIAAADVDGDGDVDLVSAAEAATAISWHENDGTPLNGGWILREISTAFAGAYAVAVADVDGDGDLDVLAGSSGGVPVTWFENDGTSDPTTWTPHAVSTVLTGAAGVAAADLDGDGDLEALAARFGASTLAWAPNLGTLVFDDGFDSDGNPACWSNVVP